MSRPTSDSRPALVSKGKDHDGRVAAPRRWQRHGAHRTYEGLERRHGIVRMYMFVSTVYTTYIRTNAICEYMDERYRTAT